MSLFKARDIWSLDLGELQRHSGDTLGNAPSPTSDIESKAQFIAHIGRFSCISGQDVFVCGDLRGVIYLIQVPDSDRRKHIKSTRNRPPTSGSAGSSGSSDQNSRQTHDDGPSPPSAFDTSERQILAAHDLGMPVVDLKCGFFTSALKQSIAVLTYHKLVILQVKPHQVDLMSAPNIGEFNSAQDGATQTLDKNLMSHEFEVNVQLDLLPGQFAYNLLTLNSHADSSLVDFDSSGSRMDLAETDLDSAETKSRKLKRTSKQIVQQLHLPQRDKIIVQYTDQFIFTLIDSKKIVGNFRVSPRSARGVAPEAVSEQSATAGQQQHELKLAQMERSLGCMPAAYLASGKSCSLALTFSDFSVHSLPLDKLTSRAKQNVMNRVAFNLFRAQMNLAPVSSELLIDVDLEATAEWSCELLGLPLAMQGLRRRLRPRPTGKEPTATTCQLLVMSRYSLDLFSANGGVHLWSQRFEAPLICMHAYKTAANEPEGEDASAGQQLEVATKEKTDTEYCDRIITLLCTDNLSNDKCNLIITSDDRVSWSALLDSKPLQIWRINLKHTPGLLATLDLMGGQLVVSYLGTNLDSSDEAALDMMLGEDCGADSEENATTNQLVQLERLDETLACESVNQNSSQRTSDDDGDLRARLRVHNSLEATGSSDGAVQICTSIQLDPSVAGVVLHDITISFEYDDLLRFEPMDGTRNVSYPAPGVAQIRLGSCWPDRREPIKINATFSFRSPPTLTSSNSKSFETTSRGFDNLNDEEITETLRSDETFRLMNSRLLPKSLKVNQLLDFNETHSGLLHQQETFLLPLSMIAQLTHIDYSSGQGQELDDVLGNLNQYKRADGTTTPALYCDLFLNLKCDLTTLLGEIIDGDLMCRERQFAPMGEQQMAIRRVETLENISLLAQSLNCRLRLMSPTQSAGILKQSSEELTQPVMVSLSLRLKANHMNGLTDTDHQRADEQIVWIHICDFTQANYSKIVSDFVDGHSNGWMKYQVTSNVDTSESVKETSRVLISIECDHALPIVLVLDHLIERVGRLGCADARFGTKIISTKNSIDHTINCLAISSKLHNSLAILASTHNSQHRDRYKQLKFELEREYCKFQVVTRTFLSLAKRLPSLPDEMNNQVTCMMKLVKQYYQNLLSVLSEMERLKEIDYEYSKMPSTRVLEIECPDNMPSRILWSGFDSIID